MCSNRRCIDIRRPSDHLLMLMLSTMLLSVGGCSQRMDDQPRVDAQEYFPYFKDGAASRAVPKGAVSAKAATYQPAESADQAWPSYGDSVFISGLKNGEPVSQLPEVLLQRLSYGQLLQRGQERFRISCVPCHDATGSGNGMVPRRGFPYPPTYHSQRLRAKPVGYFYRIATEGKGLMPAYQDLILPEDRWAIAAYVRALQFSQYAPVAQLSERDRSLLEAAR